MKPDHVLTREMMKLTGATYRQLQWWDEHGIMTPRHGVEFGIRHYSREQVDTISRMVRLRNAGIPLHMVREFIRQPFSRIVSTKKPAVLVDDVLVVFAGPPRTRAGAGRLSR